ncbi:MAG: hypothetical protein J0H92_06715 [Sphingobacteriales bacterium]|nr:hypothetical protein [Sphingobacteriales bacterium]OJW32662.1 MAG: hypothetical protein BGO54_20015 [Sphingobacteriales bacterium 46-32]
MSEKEPVLSEKESLALITAMINKARDVYHETGVSAIMWGALITICALVRYAEYQFGFRLPFDIYLLTIIAVIPQIYMSLREKKTRKVQRYDDVFISNLWLAFGICLALLILTVNMAFASWRPLLEEYKQLTGKTPEFLLGEYVTSLFLMVYGIPTFVTGASCRFRPMMWGGILCWGCAIIAIFTPFRTDLLLTAFSATMAWLIPGIVMERDYRRAKKQEQTVHV